MNLRTRIERLKRPPLFTICASVSAIAAVLLISTSNWASEGRAKLKCTPLLSKVSQVVHQENTRQITVYRSGEYAGTFDRTDREIGSIQSVHWLRPPEFFSYFKGKILDAGAGNGSFVRSMSKLGYDIFGVDIYLTDEQKSDSVRFSQQDIAHLQFDENSFDTIIATYGVLTYESIFYRNLARDAQRNFVASTTVTVLHELLRVLKPGGHLLISPVNDDENFEKALELVPQFKVIRKSRADSYWSLAFILEKAQ